LESVKLIICDDDDLIREMLSAYLVRDPGLEVVEMVNSPAALRECLARTTADVLLLDINLTENNYDGIEIAWELRKNNSALKIIALSSLDQEEVVTHALTFGQVENYVVKEHYRDLPQVIREVMAGKPSLHHSSASRVLNQLSKIHTEQIQKQFSQLQIQILEGLDAGMTRQQLADKLYHSESNIHKEICKISKHLKGSFPYLERWHLKRVDTTELIDLAKKVGLIGR
jgi:two-component system, NarL family, response regulator DevR